MTKGLVSIITPCYNGESFIQRLLDSILEQTYPDVEFIFVDDGSTDNTKSVLEPYVELFQKRGYTFHYLYQENAGQAAALDQGLKLFSGEYLTWPDSDDFYSSKYTIHKMVEALSNSHDDVSMVCCNVQIIDEETMNVVGAYARDKGEDNLLLNWIVGDGVWYCPGAYMAKSKIVNEVLIDKSIYITRAGQNLQMFIPLSYNYKCLFMGETLFSYLVRDNSHSHEFLRDQDYEKKILRSQSIITIVDECIKRLKFASEEEKSKLLHMSLVHSLMLVMKISFFSKRKHEVRKAYNELKKAKHLPFEPATFMYYCTYFPFGLLLYLGLTKLKIFKRL